MIAKFAAIFWGKHYRILDFFKSIPYTTLRYEQTRHPKKFTETHTRREGAVAKRKYGHGGGRKEN